MTATGPGPGIGMHHYGNVHPYAVPNLTMDQLLQQQQLALQQQQQYHLYQQSQLSGMPVQPVPRAGYHPYAHPGRASMGLPGGMAPMMNPRSQFQPQPLATQFQPRMPTQSFNPYASGPNYFPARNMPQQPFFPPLPSQNVDNNQWFG